MSPTVTVDAAYRHCEEVTARQAKNFYYGIKLLPPPKRRAMSALYALARRIDDIGDGDGPPAARLAELAEVRTQIRDLAASGASAGGDDPVMVAVADVRRHYPLPLTALEELVEGCQMDVTGTRYETFDDLVGYCRRVAGTVGRLSLSVYGCRPEDLRRAQALADDLGVALQITNILRDIVEDKSVLGRVYLPARDLARFDVGPDLDGRKEDLVALVAFESGRAQEWFDRSLPLLDLLDRRSRAATAAMAGIYRRLLAGIRRDPAAVLRGRLSVPSWEKAAVAVRALAGVPV